MGIDPLTRRAVFLDRDGVLVRNVHYADENCWEGPRRAGELVLADGAADALKRLASTGYLLILVSNQPNPAKGKTTLAETQATHDRMADELGVAGIVLDKAYYCYHHPGGVLPTLSGPCDCRKPSPFFLLAARDTFALDMAACWMVGDRAGDIECGYRAGAKTILIDPDHPSSAPPCRPDYRAVNIAAAADLILAACAR